MKDYSSRGYLSAGEVAAYLGIAVKDVHKLARCNELKSRKSTSGQYRFDLTEVKKIKTASNGRKAPKISTETVLDIRGTTQFDLPGIDRRRSKRANQIDERVCRLINADCIEGLQNLRADSVHFVATDPPYFLHGMGDEWDKAKLNRRVKPGVVGGLPSGMKFDRNQSRRLRKFMFEVAVQLYRVLKPGGFAAIFSQARLSHAVGTAFDEAGFEIRDMLAWKYEGQAKAFSQTHFVRKMKMSEAAKETIIKQIAGRKTPQLKPQFEPIILAQKPKEGTFVDNWMKHRIGLMSPQQSLMGSGFPGTILEAPKPRKGAEFGHMTVKPVIVMRQLIRLFTVEGQTVLDPFMGSGTTAVAALHDLRKFIGFEIDADYTEIARRRIRDEKEIL